ncbi:MAG: uroporphyrinogen-III synthase [Bacilli bacterium]
MCANIVFLRPVESLADTAELAKANGFEAACFPLTRIRSVEHDIAIAPASHVLITSRHAVDFMKKRMRPDLTVWAIGDETEKALRCVNIAPERPPTRAALQKVCAWMSTALTRERPIFYPHSRASDLSPLNALRRVGFDVVTEVVYEPVKNDEMFAALANFLNTTHVQWFVFTSGAQVRALLQEDAHVAQLFQTQLKNGSLVATIGPETSKVCTHLGISVQTEATFPAVAQLLKQMMYDKGEETNDSK